MLIALLGAPNAGKSQGAARRVGCLHVPVHFLLLAAHRRDRVALWGDGWHELLDPMRFIIGAPSGYPPPGERILIRELCCGTAREVPEADVALLAHLCETIRRKWEGAGRDLIAEGEVLAKSAWLKALRPDRIELYLAAPERGVIRTERRKGLHPSLDWDEARYRDAQLAVVDIARRWLGRDL